MIYPLIPFGGFIFIALMLLFTTGASIAAHEYSAKWTTAFVLAALVLAFGFTYPKIPIPSLITLSIMIPIFFTLGVAYALLKWARMVIAIRKYTLALEDEGRSKSIIQELIYSKFMPVAISSFELDMPPNPKQFRTEIGMWIVNWPLFILRDLVNYISFDIIGKIGDMTSGLFYKISKKFYS